jgi:hypothetical protein
MDHPEQNLALLAIFAVICATLFNLFRYFTNADFADRQSRPLQLFVVFTSTHLISACILLGNDIIAWYRDYFFMYVWPIERRASIELVIVNFAVALLASMVAVLMIHRKVGEGWLPGNVPWLIFTCLAVLASVLSSYISSLGFCCESPITVFAGFPFSFLWGVGLPYDLSFETFRQFSTAEIVRHYNSQLRWYPDFQRLIYDFLFWGSAASLLLISSNRLTKKHPMPLAQE